MKWFKHDCDASNDEFIARLEAEFGIAGYAHWFKLMETIGRQMDETNKCYAEYSEDQWMRFLGFKQKKKLKTFLNFCQTFDKLVTKLSGNFLKIECPNLLKKRDNYSRNLQVTSNENCNQEVEVDTTTLLSAGASDSDVSEKAPDPLPPEIPKADSRFSEVAAELQSIIASPSLLNMSVVHGWLAAGADPELDIYPTVRLLLDRQGSPPSSMKYFQNAILEACAQRKHTPKLPEIRDETVSTSAGGRKSSKADRIRAAVERSNAKGFGFTPRPSGTGAIGQDARDVVSDAEIVREGTGTAGSYH